MLIQINIEVPDSIIQNRTIEELHHLIGNVARIKAIKEVNNLIRKDNNWMLLAQRKYREYIHLYRDKYLRITEYPVSIAKVYNIVFRRISKKDKIYFVDLKGIDVNDNSKRC